MQTFVAGWIEQARRYGIPSELIIVEWNPPADRPRLDRGAAVARGFGSVRRPLHRGAAGAARAICAWRCPAALSDDRQECRHTARPRAVRTGDQYRHSVLRRTGGVSGGTAAGARPHVPDGPARRDERRAGGCPGGRATRLLRDAPDSHQSERGIFQRYAGGRTGVEFRRCCNARVGHRLRAGLVSAGEPYAAHSFSLGGGTGRTSSEQASGARIRAGI